MINPFHEINWNPGRGELRKFAWSLIIGFPCIAVVFYLIGAISTRGLPGPGPYLQLGGIGTTVGLVCLLVPVIARPLYTVWYVLAACIGIVVANLLFILLFYCVFTPMGLIMRLLGRDALRLKRKNRAASYWIDAPPSPPATQYFNQY